jgi:hypothetical protein
MAIRSFRVAQSGDAELVRTRLTLDGVVSWLLPPTVVRTTPAGASESATAILPSRVAQSG